MFKLANAYYPNINSNIFETYKLFDENITASNETVLRNLKLTKSDTIDPVNKHIRKKVICLLEGKNEYGKTNTIYTLLWNSTLPITFIFILFIYCIKKKKLFESLLLIFILLKSLLIFVTAPETYFMYYFSEYIIGYELIMISILYLYINIKLNKQISLQAINL